METYKHNWSAHDQEIYDKASRLHWYDWIELDRLSREAEDPHLKEILKGRSSSGYHRDEASIGLL